MKKNYIDLYAVLVSTGKEFIKIDMMEFSKTIKK